MNQTSNLNASNVNGFEFLLLRIKRCSYFRNFSLEVQYRQWGGGGGAQTLVSDVTPVTLVRALRTCTSRHTAQGVVLGWGTRQVDQTQTLTR